MLTHEQYLAKIKELTDDPEKCQVSLACISGFRESFEALTDEYVQRITGLLNTYEFEARLIDFSFVLASSSSTLQSKAPTTPDVVSILGIEDSVRVSLGALKDAFSKQD